MFPLYEQIFSRDNNFFTGWKIFTEWNFISRWLKFFTAIINFFTAWNFHGSHEVKEKFHSHSKNFSYFHSLDHENWHSVKFSQAPKMHEGSQIHKSKGLDSREITALANCQNISKIAEHFNHCQKSTTCSSRDSLAYNKSLQLSTNRVSDQIIVLIITW